MNSKRDELLRADRFKSIQDRINLIARKAGVSREEVNTQAIMWAIHQTAFLDLIGRTYGKTKSN